MDAIANQKTKPYTWEEKKDFCERWKVSGQSKAQFCQERHLALATFYGWCNRVWPRQKKRKETNLFPVKITDSHPASTSQAPIEQAVIEIRMTNDTLIGIKLPLKKLVSFIQELSHATAIIR